MRIYKYFGWSRTCNSNYSMFNVKAFSECHFKLGAFFEIIE